MATNNSGRDVEKATRINPTVVLPRPVISAILTEFVMVELLALFKISRATNKTIPVAQSLLFETRMMFRIMLNKC